MVANEHFWWDNSAMYFIRNTVGKMFFVLKTESTIPPVFTTRPYPTPIGFFYIIKKPGFQVERSYKFHSHIAPLDGGSVPSLRAAIRMLI